MKPFRLFQPTNVEKCIALLRQYKKNAKIMAGGTDLLIKMKERKTTPKNIIYINEIPELKHISLDEDKVTIGAATTISEIEKSAILQREFRILTQAAGKLGGYQTRNLATVGGNLCNASPSAELAPALIVLDAELKIMGSDGCKKIAVEDFFLGPSQTVLKNDEICVEILIPRSGVSPRGTYMKLGTRNGMDLAIVSIAILIVLDSEKQVFEDFKIALGAVAPTPIRIREAEEQLKGKLPSKDLVQKISLIASDKAKPISDIRGSAEYRKEMIKVLTKRAIILTLKEYGYNL